MLYLGRHRLAPDAPLAPLAPPTAPTAAERDAPRAAGAPPSPGGSGAALAHVVRAGYSTCAHAYLLSRRGAARLLRALRARGGGAMPVGGSTRPARRVRGGY